MKWKSHQVSATNWGTRSEQTRSFWVPLTNHSCWLWALVAGGHAVSSARAEATDSRAGSWRGRPPVALWPLPLSGLGGACTCLSGKQNCNKDLLFPYLNNGSVY